MENFKQRYEDFYYDFARPIINEQNARIKERIVNLVKNSLNFTLYFWL